MAFNRRQTLLARTGPSGLASRPGSGGIGTVESVEKEMRKRKMTMKSRSNEEILLAMEVLSDCGISRTSYAYEELMYMLPEKERPATPIECNLEVEVVSPGGELTAADRKRIDAAIQKNWTPLSCGTKTREVIVTAGNFSW